MHQLACRLWLHSACTQEPMIVCRLVSVCAGRPAAPTGIRVDNLVKTSGAWPDLKIYVAAPGGCGRLFVRCPAALMDRN